jgi:DNA mismatch repair ATPase MutS
LDVLLSLSTFSASQEDMCRPSVIYSDTPFVNIIDGRHPCISADSYIPNSCKLGSASENESQVGTFVLLTGPNMGGKSTFMRQVGLLSVLAHMVCCTIILSIFLICGTEMFMNLNHLLRAVMFLPLNVK